MPGGRSSGFAAVGGLWPLAYTTACTIPYKPWCPVHSPRSIWVIVAKFHTILFNFSPPLHYYKTSTGYPLNGEYISNWPPWRIRHCTLASHLICPNCYNIMNPQGLCDLPLLLNCLLYDTTLNLARVHFESQHQKYGTYCLPIPTFRRHLNTHYFQSAYANPLPTRPDSL